MSARRALAEQIDVSVTARRAAYVAARRASLEAARGYIDDAPESRQPARRAIATAVSVASVIALADRVAPRRALIEPEELVATRINQVPTLTLIALESSATTPARTAPGLVKPARVAAGHPRARTRRRSHRLVATISTAALLSSVVGVGASSHMAAASGALIPTSPVASIDAAKQLDSRGSISRGESRSVLLASPAIAGLASSIGVSDTSSGSASGSSLNAIGAVEHNTHTATPDAQPGGAPSASPTEAPTALPAPPPPPAPPKECELDGIIAPGQKTPLSCTQAVANAKALTGSTAYPSMCLALVARFYGYTSSGEVGAYQAAQTIIAAGQMHTDMSNIPVGALMFYDGRPRGNPYGHVAMYAGAGMIFSNGAGPGGAVGKIGLYTPSQSWGEPVIGWAPVWLPNATK